MALTTDSSRAAEQGRGLRLEARSQELVVEKFSSALASMPQSHGGDKTYGRDY